MKHLLLFVVLSFFTYKTYAMPVRYKTNMSFMKVVISSSEFDLNKISSKEYSINKRYHLSSSFLKNNYFKILKRLQNYDIKKSDPIFLEYVKLGNGKKMVTSIAVPY